MLLKRLQCRFFQQNICKIQTLFRQWFRQVKASWQATEILRTHALRRESLAGFLGNDFHNWSLFTLITKAFISLLNKQVHLEGAQSAVMMCRKIQVQDPNKKNRKTRDYIFVHFFFSPWVCQRASWMTLLIRRNYWYMHTHK